LPEELFEIYSGFLSKKQYVLTPEAVEKAKEALLEIYENRDDSFANGRTARNLADETVRRQSGRISALEKHLRDREIFMTITAEDIPLAPRAKELSVDEILSDLDSMIGLTELKAEVRVLADSIRMDRERVAGGGAQAEAQSYHIVFTGNPGTGKTTVARKLGALFKAMGLLPSGKVIEVDRSKLVAGYVGQTAPQTNKIIDEAMGGILFIDEAYTLAQGGQDAFGQEAIDTLLKRMEDDKGRFVVIAAGYRREMERFISSNSGLESRFTKFFNLVDYTAAELQSIYEHTAAKNGYTIAGDARPVLAKAVQAIYAGRGETFANGREMRKLFEETRRRQAARLARLDKTERTAQALGTITAGDIPVQEGGEA
ncbi:MAG: AAA family ATPase, partial [Treponema sp.]|nr:AAA family ATPase [Treponema sp.]